ncbi:MAG: PD-(D/E)XK nuclease family protein [Opitutaceae bacterium]|nr:PD-(D/E)XK nuclease family protein [Opitutaceae bacterium]
MAKSPEMRRADPGGGESGVRRHVLPWERPLPRSAAEWFARDWTGRGPLDLGDWLVVVPTRQSGRRLREALAMLAAEAGQAAFPPKVVLPEFFLSTGEGRERVASRAQHLLAWIEALRKVKLEDVRAVFPVDPASRSFTWARELGAQLMKLQRLLLEGGLTIASVSPAMRAGGAAFSEDERWTQLAGLTREVERILRRSGLEDPILATLEQSKVSGLPEGIERIAVIATPDPIPLAASVLARHAERIPVSVLIHGPLDEPVDALFDAWGRPLPEAWCRRRLDWPDFKERVHLCADPREQAEQVAGLAGRAPDARELLGIGVADTSVLPALEQSLKRAGFVAYNPSGHPWRNEGFHALLSVLADFARSDSWDAVRGLVRCPDVLEWLRTAAGPRGSAARLLSETDAIGEAHLPPTLSEAIRHASPGEGEADAAGRFSTARDALARLAGLRSVLVAGSFPGNAVTALQQIFAGRRIEAGSLLFESIEAWTETLREAAAALESMPSGRIGLNEAWELCLSLHGERVRFPERNADALELSGWLELLWEDAPHLVIAGMNDGCVPESVVGDAFLPEAARRRIGLTNNAMRFARDAYMLQSVAASRAGGAGRLDLLVGKTAATGDPLKPSRLLLQCRDGELPDRVGWLFRNVEAGQASVPWTRAWRLRPKPAAPPERVSVTALRDWLACPFRFHLRHALGLRRVELDKAELDARDFGNLIHATLQHLADPEARRLDPRKDLPGFLLDHFEREASRRYGDLRTLPLLAQFQSARQRILKAAAIEADERDLGWRTERVEWKFDIDVRGIRIRGVIDRVDLNEKTPGRVRVVDYKTSDRAVPPQVAHLRTSRRGDDARDAWQRVLVGGKEHVWTDLQLPVYRLVLEKEFGSGVECGYFNLPKAIADSKVALWEDLDAGLQRSANACLEGVSAAIAAGRFWPPVEIPRPEDDDWAELFHRGAVESIDPEVAGKLKGTDAPKGGGS